MKPLVTMREALADAQLLGNAIPGGSWLLWRTLLIAAMGEALTDDERKLFTDVTGRDVEPLERVDEFWNVVGRRAGKTRAAGTWGAYVAGLCDWTSHMAPGERFVLPVLAASTYQASRAFQHMEGILTASPMLRSRIDGKPTSDTIRLKTRVDIEIMPANFKTVRSITAVGAIADELAFWSIEGHKNPDREILNALRPALLTTGGMLMVISSPYARKGELYRTHRSDFGQQGDPLILVTQGTSKKFNSTLPQADIDKAYRRDPSAARAEFGGEFRVDVETILTQEAVEAVVESGIVHRPRRADMSYVGFVDPSGGSADSMTLAIAHNEDGKAVLDRTVEKKVPFSPEVVTADFAKELKSYGISQVTGDAYAGEWPREAFRRHGIEYRVSKETRSELYLGLIPTINSRDLVLLDDARLISQLGALERRTGRLGRDIIDHPTGGHDDLANAVAGALWNARPSKTAPVTKTFAMAGDGSPAHAVETSRPPQPYYSGGRTYVTPPHFPSRR
jgi:hypothetical protein